MLTAVERHNAFIREIRRKLDQEKTNTEHLAETDNSIDFDEQVMRLFQELLASDGEE